MAVTVILCPGSNEFVLWNVSQDVFNLFSISFFFKTRFLANTKAEIPESLITYRVLEAEMLDRGEESQLKSSQDAEN